MIQTYKDFEQAESEQTSKLLAEIERLEQIIKDIHTCARRFEWGLYTVDSPEGYVYRKTKQEVIK